MAVMESFNIKIAKCSHNGTGTWRFVLATLFCNNMEPFSDSSIEERRERKKKSAKRLGL
jgi:hypothetical protein